MDKSNQLKITIEERIRQLEVDLEATKKKLKKVKTQKANVEETLNRSLLETKKRDEEIGRFKKVFEAPSSEELLRQYVRDLNILFGNIHFLIENMERDIKDGFLINTEPIYQALEDAVHKLRGMALQNKNVVEIPS